MQAAESVLIGAKCPLGLSRPAISGRTHMRSTKRTATHGMNGGTRRRWSRPARGVEKEQRGLSRNDLPFDKAAEAKHPHRNVRIAGFVNLDGAPANASVIGAMTDMIRHRGPDDRGTLCLSLRGGIPDTALGFQRLQILELSARGRQPMTNPDGSTALLFNGEIYDAVDSSRSRRDGYRFRTGTIPRASSRSTSAKGSSGCSNSSMACLPS